MEQFVALGYIEDSGADRAKQADSADVEAKYNLACTLLWKSRTDEAMELLSELVRQWPWEDRFLITLAAAYFEGGYLRQAERLLALSFALAQPNSAMVLLLHARIKLSLGEFAAGLESLSRAESMNPHLPQLQVHLGYAHVRLLRWAEAQAAFEKAIVLDPDSALAFQGLATVSRRLHRNQETVDNALRALSRLHWLPLAHFNLGLALARSGESERAQLAFESALRFQPQLLNAHRYLAVLHNLAALGRGRAAVRGGCAA